MSKQERNNLEIIVQTKNLAHALNFANSVVEKRNIITELSNIKLSVDDNSLLIQATDLDLYLSQKIGANVIHAGNTTVSTQTLSEIVRKIPDTEITIKQSDSLGVLELISATCHFELLTLPVTHFPDMEDIETGTNVTIPATELARIIEYTSFAMSNDETRYSLNGIYLHTKNGKFCSVATDGHRLSFAAVESIHHNEPFGVIVPKKTVMEILKIIKDNKYLHHDVSIFLNLHRIKFICNNIILISKLIDGVFPQYEEFIPVDYSSTLTVNTKLIASAIDRVSTVTIEKFRTIKLLITNNGIEISASGDTKGKAREILSFSEEEGSYCMFVGDITSINCNPKYILDIFNAINDSKVKLYFGLPGFPLLISASENSYDSFVVMPVKG